MASGKSISWKRALIQFSVNTTCHGLRYVALSNSFRQRLMWIVTVVACVCAVGYQIIDRVMFYYDWPVNVNVKINYNQSLAFPAVTICNQNAFKATEAAKYGYYDLIEDMFSKTTDETLDSIQYYGANNVTLEELYVKLRHRKEDFVVKCRWSRGDCSPSQFETILTDHGVCYKFKENSTRMTVSSSGVEAGLRLTLNVEQYEYMAGPHDAAGIKMLLHDPREIPSVHALGQAIPTGTHAFVGVKFMVIKNLEYPYGNCKNESLEHTNYYTTEECYIGCLTKVAKKVCGCRDMYMPDAYGNNDVCSLDQYFSCLKDFEDTFNEKYAPECRCPVPCEFSLFEPTLSYATVSNHVVRTLLTSKESLLLKDSLLHASETTARMDKTKRDEFRSLVLNLCNRVNDIKQLFDQMSEYLSNQTSTMERIRNETKSAYTQKERLYRFQIYSIERNFLRGREAMEERVLANVALGFAEFAMLNARKIRHLTSIPENETSSREALYRSVVDSLTVRQQIADLAKNNISVLYDAFVNGTRIFNYMFEDISRSHNDHIVPKPLLHESMFYNTYVRKYGPKLFDDLDLMHDVLDMFISEATTAYVNMTINETSLNYVFERYQFACRTFMYSRSVIYSQGIDRPVPILNERRYEFDKIWDDFSTHANALEQNFKALIGNLENIEENIVKQLDSLVKQLQDYFNSSNQSLMDLAKTIFSTDTQRMVSAIKDFFQEIDNRGQDIYDSWTIMLKHITTLWTKIIDDEDMIDYYNFTNNERFLQNLTEVLSSYTCQCRGVRDNFDVRKSVMRNEDEEFFRAVSAVTEHLNEFKSSLKVDSSFLRDNFLQLDIFFRQLSYEDITQQKAYDFFALICDIGGSMGLFIGASMLTIVEIIDLILSQTPIFGTEREKKLKVDEF